MDYQLAGFEAVRRGGLRAPGSWIGIATSIEPSEELAGEIISEAQVQFNRQVYAIDARAADPFKLAQDIQSRGADWLLLLGLDAWSQQNWNSSELNRNSWIREDGLTWFLLGPSATSSIARYAPNVRSLIGPYIVVGPTDLRMTSEERASRLAQLRDFYRRTDAEITAEAESHALEMSPHMVEWLILLDRGDLV